MITRMPTGRTCAAIGSAAVLAVTLGLTLIISGVALSLGWCLGIAAVVGIALGLAL